VIADPNPAPIATAQPAPQAQPANKEGVLTETELYQLTLYKWRYSLEAYGFEDHEVRELMFLKWLHASRRVQP
jgi:hypothetical protein